MDFENPKKGLMPTNGLNNPNNNGVDGKEIMNQLEYEMEYDPETLAKVRTLERARAKAEIHEDYVEAKRINQAIVELKKLSH
jgi:hypothetical protein